MITSDTPIIVDKPLDGGAHRTTLGAFCRDNETCHRERVLMVQTLALGQRYEGIGEDHTGPWSIRVDDQADGAAFERYDNGAAA